MQKIKQKSILFEYYAHCEGFVADPLDPADKTRGNLNAYSRKVKSPSLTAIKCVRYGDLTPPGRVDSDHHAFC